MYNPVSFARDVRYRSDRLAGSTRADGLTLNTGAGVRGGYIELSGMVFVPVSAAFAPVTPAASERTTAQAKKVRFI